MSTATRTEPATRLLTIGAVCGRVREEFQDISISKIRYLEDQGLLTPKRTRGGYRLFSEDDVERLQTILRLQRDEFLPLRVIREELASPAAAERARRKAPGLGESEAEIDLDELCHRAGDRPTSPASSRSSACCRPRVEGGERRYRESDAEIAAACGRLARYGIDARHLRTFRTAADRQAALLEQLVAPALAREPRAAQGRPRRPEGARGDLPGARAAALLARPEVVAGGPLRFSTPSPRVVADIQRGHVRRADRPLHAGVPGSRGRHGCGSRPSGGWSDSPARRIRRCTTSSSPAAAEESTGRSSATTSSTGLRSAWAPAAVVNLMTARLDDAGAELGELAATRIGAGEWPWSFYCYLEERPRPVTPSSFLCLAPGDDALGLAVRCPVCASISVNLVSGTSTCRSGTTRTSAWSLTCSPTMPRASSRSSARSSSRRASTSGDSTCNEQRGRLTLVQVGRAGKTRQRRQTDARRDTRHCDTHRSRHRRIPDLAGRADGRRRGGRVLGDVRPRSPRPV